MEDYSYGACLDFGKWPAGVHVGRYTSVGPNVQVFRRNHRLERLSLPPFFYNHKMGFVDRATITSVPLLIEADAWIGANAISLPRWQVIGFESVIGAGAFVTRDIPPLAVYGENPARLIKSRFPGVLQSDILESQWWRKPIDQLAQRMKEFPLPAAETLAHVTSYQELG